MASTTESLETSANSLPSFSFPTQFMSFSSLLYDSDPANASPENRNSPARISVTRGFSDRTSGIPKFKSFPPPSLPLSPPPFSPSSYLSIPPGLSPADLLDSPVLLSTSNILASPTTGTFPSQVFNWRSSSAAASGGNGNYQQTIKVEQKGSSDFSFQPETKQVPGSIFQSSSATISTEEALKRQQQRQPWNYLEPNKPAEFSASTYGGAVGKTNIKAEFVAPIHSVSPEITTNETGFQSNFSHNSQPSQTLREQRKSEDGFNWRKYGQKQVKGSENPRSYYKCTYPNCPMKKKVERSFEGQITEIVYKGTHNHAKPQSTRRTAAAQATQANREAIKVEGGSSWAKLPLKVNSESLEISSPASVVTEISDPSLMGQPSPAQMESIGTPDNSSISVGEEEFDQSSQRSRSGGEELDDTEPDAKRWRKESENEGISASGSRTMREPRVVVQTTSDIDILDDGYRWRKYGQKVVKGNPNPRSYYKCTHLGCLVRKHVERASHDLRAVITTYEGKHNHDVPAARGSASHALANKLAPDNNFSNAIRSSAMAKFSNHMTCNSSFGGTPPVSREGQAPFTLEMVQSPTSYEQTGFENFSGPYMGPMKGMETRFTKAKDEPRDELFFDSLLC